MKKLTLFAAMLVALLATSAANGQSSDGDASIATGLFVMDNAAVFSEDAPNFSGKLTGVISPEYGEIDFDQNGELRYSPLLVNEEFLDDFFVVVETEDFGTQFLVGTYDPEREELHFGKPSQQDITDSVAGAGAGSTAFLVAMPVVQGKPEREIVIGIHSSSETDGDFTGGHVWVTISDTFTGKTTTYGLWPDDNDRVPDNGDGTDVRTGVEQDFTAVRSRFRKITQEQLNDFYDFANTTDHWTIGHTCAEWGSQAYHECTGEYVDPNDSWGWETPRKVARSIEALEETDDTSSTNPGGVGTGGGGGNGTSCCGG
jgi:hypothetical protein